jgi:glycyl-tRNA synthetase (class II)
MVQMHKNIVGIDAAIFMHPTTWKASGHVDAFSDPIYVDSNLTAINYLNWQHEVKVYPNPANNYFTVSSSLTNIQKISMLNQFGEAIYKNQNPHLP